jgi:hypothetical protein
MGCPCAHPAAKFSHGLDAERKGNSVTRKKSKTCEKHISIDIIEVDS